MIANHPPHLGIGYRGGDFIAESRGSPMLCARSMKQEVYDGQGLHRGG